MVDLEAAKAFGERECADDSVRVLNARRFVRELVAEVERLRGEIASMLKAPPSRALWTCLKCYATNSDLDAACTVCRMPLRPASMAP